METKAEMGTIIGSEKQAYYNAYRVTKEQAKAFEALECCRTEKMGVHMVECDHCHSQQVRYNSCRNRHCPKCQGRKQQQWASKLRDQLLPCRYFHIVFTIPCQLNDLVYGNQEIMYDILMQSAMEALIKVAANPRFLGVSTGCLCVLHTWGQNLLFHPHVHMLVPAGGPSPDGWEWIESGKKFFVPVKVLSKVFRGVFITKLLGAYNQKQLEVPSGIDGSIKQLYAINWNVYCKKVFGGPGQVLTYLGRYSHRVAISNNRILSYSHGKVRFRWKDYRQKVNKSKVMEISGLEFVRRFMLHVLPHNFYKIRYSGIFANTVRGQILKRCRYLLAALLELELIMNVTPDNGETCPKCKSGKLQLVVVGARPET